MLTKEQVLEIQSHPDAFDWTGKKLVADGNYGPKTQWWHYIMTLHPTRQAIVTYELRLYATGIKDDGNNHGVEQDGVKWVDRFVEPGHLGLGVPWCIAMQSWVLSDSVYVDADYPIYHMSAFKLLEWAKGNNRITTRPLPGDLHAFLYPKGHKLYGSGHGGGVLMPGSSWTAVCDGNVGDTIKVGMRATEGLTFIRTVDDDVQPAAVSSMGLERLDGWRDR